MLDFQKSIGRETAIKMYEDKWWEGKSATEVAHFQLITAELCIPVSQFLEALSTALGRSVYPHELCGENPKNLLDELNGERQAPSIDEIFSLIPTDTIIILAKKEAFDEEEEDPD